MENNENKDERAAALAAKSESALKILKITVIITAACAIVLPAVSLILLVCADKPIYGLVGLIISLCVFAAMLAVLAFVIVYVRGCIKKLKSLDGDEKE